MSGTVDDVLVVGGGDAGLLAALALRKLNPAIDVSVVDDFDAPNPQVGKASFLEIRSILHGTLGIDERRFIEEVKPVWKLTVYFRDWCDRPEFHYPFDPGRKFPSPNVPNSVERYYHWYEEGCRDPDHRTIGEEIAAQGKSPWHFDASTGEYDIYENVAYHLDTERFNGFLRDLCRERGVSLLNDRITSVETASGKIGRVRSQSQIYDADLYVDATGFTRLLKSELDGELESFDIPLDSAFTTQVERPLSEVIPASVVDTGSNGWFWRIDTYDHSDLGYVFASEYVDDEAARAEFVEHFDWEVDPADVTKYEFDSGYYEPSWETNCVAIGNAAGFMEPLEAPALTTHARSAITLSQQLSAHGRIADDALRESFNAWVRQAWEAIYDFICVHYKFSSGDTEFWEAMGDLPVSDRLETLIDAFDSIGFDRSVDLRTQYPELGTFDVFEPESYLVIMRNMGATSSFYEDNDFEIGDSFRDQVQKIDESTTDHVDQYLTTEEAYKTIFET